MIGIDVTHLLEMLKENECSILRVFGSPQSFTHFCRSRVSEKRRGSALCLPWTASVWHWLCSSILASSSWHQLSKSLFSPVKGIFMYCRSFWEFWVVPSHWSRGMKRRLLLEPAGIPFRTFQVAWVHYGWLVVFPYTTPFGMSSGNVWTCPLNLAPPALCFSGKSSLGEFRMFY